MGPRYVQKKFLEFQTSKEKSVSIVMKDGKTVPLLVKPVAITFRKELKTTVDNEIKKRKYCKGPKNLTMCEKCGKRFPNEERLVTHMETHHENSFRCTTCNKLFPTEVARRKHRYIVHSIKYTCDFCQVTLKSKKAYLVHTRRHAGEYSHKCEECGKEFYNSFSYNHHMDAEHAGIRYPCTICTSVLKSKRYFKAHMANHKEMAAIQFQCKVCKKYYSTKSGLLAHSKAHLDSRYVCDVCGKKSIQKGAHDAHMRSHTGERSFMCDLCGKGFIRKDVLDKHMAKVHESYKQACEKCGEFFLTNYELLIHMHTHDDIEKPFACEFCSERFLDKNILRNHVNRVHVENKPDKLAKNKIRTKVANNTTRKKKTEKKVGGFYCSICKAGYNTVASYKEHLHIHRTPYACNLCDVKFGDYLKLKAHLLRHDEDLKDENELEEEDDDYDNADDDDEEEEGEEIDNDGFFQREIKGETTDEEVSQGGLLEVEECQDETLVISEHDIAEINLKEETVITNEDDLCKTNEANIYDLNLGIEASLDCCDLNLQSKCLLLINNTENIFDNIESNPATQLSDTDKDILELLAEEKDCTEILQKIGSNEQFERLMSSENFIDSLQLSDSEEPGDKNLEALVKRPLNSNDDKFCDNLNCELCNKEFKSKRMLRLHLSTQHARRLFVCDICSKSFKQNSDLTAHLKGHYKPTFQCDICAQLFVHKSHLTAHRKKHTGEFTKICNICDKGFVNMSSYVSHVNVQHKKIMHVCDVCGQKLSSLSSLNEHKTIHSPHYGKQRNHVCDTCGKTYLTARNLKTHQRTHSRGNKYICNICGKSLSSKKVLETHIKTHVGEKNFLCDYCNKSFAAKEYLTTHLRTHTGDKPFKCKLCDKSFTQRTSLTVHIRYHTGERPYKCHCGKGFITKSRLTCHYKTHDAPNLEICYVPQENCL